MAEEKNKLTKKYEFKSKLNLNTKNTNIAKRAEIISADKYNQNWLNRKIQEQDLPYLPLNILQNNTYEPEEQEKSNYTNNNTINNVTSNITNYHMQANFKAIDNIKKNYLVNKYIENNVFNTNIKHGDIISAKNIAVADWHFKSPYSYIDNEILTENVNFKRAIQNFNQNAETVNVLLENYQKLKAKVEQISTLANINSVFKNEESIETLNLAINRLSDTVLKNDILLELSAQYKKDKKVFYKLNRIIKSNLEPAEQFAYLFDAKNSITPKVKKSALALLLQSVRKQIEIYNEAKEINREERGRIDRRLEERIGIVQNRERILEEKEQRKRLQLNVVRRIEEEKRETNREERGRIERRLEERIGIIRSRERELEEKELRKKLQLNVVRKIEEEKEEKKQTRETNREELGRIERKIEERIGIIQNRERELEEKELRKRLQLNVVRRTEEEKEEKRKKLTDIWNRENKILERIAKTRFRVFSDDFSKKTIFNVIENTVVEPTAKLVFKEDNINSRSVLVNQKDITKYREILGYQHVLLNAARDHFNSSIEKEIFLVAQKSKKVKTKTYNRDIKEVFISHKNDDTAERLETVFKKVFEQMPLNDRQQIVLPKDITERTKYNNITTQSLQKGQEKQMGNYELNNIITQRIDDNIPEIADKVYAAIDNKLKTERYRMGLF